LQKLHEVSWCIAGEKLFFLLMYENEKLAFLLFSQMKQLDFVDS